MSDFAIKLSLVTVMPLGEARCVHCFSIAMGGYQPHACSLVNRCSGTVISHYIRKSLSTLRLSHRIRLIVQQESNAEPNSPLEPHPFYSWNLRLSQPERGMYYSTNLKNVNTFKYVSTLQCAILKRKRTIFYLVALVGCLRD